MKEKRIKKMTETVLVVLVGLLLMANVVAQEAPPSVPSVPRVKGATEPILIDASQPGRIFEGLGALSAGASSRLLIDYPEPQRSEILDFLFKPKFGASLQHLKVEVGGDVNSTDGTEPSIARTREEFEHPKPEYFNRGYEWWLMKEAKKRNPAIVFDVLQWGAPGWIGGRKFYSQDNADLIVAFIKGAKKYHDLDISYCGIWNERAYDVAWIKLLRQTLNKAGLEGVKIVAADEVRKWTIADKMVEDADLREAIQVIGTHYPLGRSSPAAQSLNKPLWSSEEGPWSGDWEASRNGGLARAYSRNYALGKMTKSIVWSPITSYYDCLPVPGSGLMRASEPWSGHYELPSSLWITAHTTQFIQPGWKYLDSACKMLPGGGSCVAAVEPAGKDFSVIVETKDAKKPQHLSFRLAGGLKSDGLSVWRSTAKEQFIRQSDLRVNNGAFELMVEPDVIYSLTTTQGQQKPQPTIPASASMPLPYREDFSTYPAGCTPRWISDYIGAFETAMSSDGRACLRQLILAPGISWWGDKRPITILGDAAWKDYEVACDVKLDFKKSVVVFARIKAAELGNIPQGYFLSVQASGAWQLFVHSIKLVEVPATQGNATAAPFGHKRSRHVAESLAKGVETLKPGAWFRMGLRCVGNKITVLINGREVGVVSDSTFDHGHVGLGCDYEPVQFTNLTVIEANATRTSDETGKSNKNQSNVKPENRTEK